VDQAQFLFAGHAVDTDRSELCRGSTTIALEPQVFDLLVYLVRNRDRVVCKDDLFASVWAAGMLRIRRLRAGSKISQHIGSSGRSRGDCW
jgi:DNA-binding winged helix-turn-helix (wHTH) protein